MTGTRGKPAQELRSTLTTSRKRCWRSWFRGRSSLWTILNYYHFPRTKQILACNRQTNGLWMFIIEIPHRVAINSPMHSIQIAHKTSPCHLPVRLRARPLHLGVGLAAFHPGRSRESGLWWGFVGLHKWRYSKWIYSLQWKIHENPVKEWMIWG